MEPSTRDALTRAARLERLELAAALLPEPETKRRDLRGWLAAALALLITCYPGISAAMASFI